jgi:pimeloyl-ACP methyl ester carboxylesterase
MTTSRSDHILIRGLRYHVRRWGAAEAPMLFLMHGWMDVSATFEPVAERLASRLQVLAPDWRGFGETDWPQDGYWFADYVADLDALVDHYSPGQPVAIAGHSMGATAVSHFAGLRPHRVSRLAVLDGLALPDGDPANIVATYRRWLDAVRRGSDTPTYRSFDELAARVQKRHPHLGTERCRFIARCWGRQGTDGRVHLQSDPKHLINMPRTYLQAESDAIWSQVTAPTLFVDGGASVFRKTLPDAEIARRRALFRDRREVQIDGVGHMLHFEAPEALADRLLAFFAPEPG